MQRLHVGVRDYTDRGFIGGDPPLHAAARGRESSAERRQPAPRLLRAGGMQLTERWRGAEEGEWPLVAERDAGGENDDPL